MTPSRSVTRRSWLRAGMALGLPLALTPRRGRAADDVDAPPAPTGPSLGDFRRLSYRVGLTVSALGGPCRDVYASLPLPAEWPEQRVEVIDEETTPDIRNLRYRTLPGGGVRQLLVDIPALPVGQEARAVVTLDVERAALIAPEDTSRLSIPPKPAKDLKPFLGPSPSIETRHPKVVRFAKSLGEGLEGWEKVEAIYDGVRAKIEYRDGPLKGAARALADGWGDCEELTCLFIACARYHGIPARTVWVEGHCYPEFHLVDDEGRGSWFPCQAAGTRAFGSMPDQLPILQKGDSFRDPDRPGKSLRYVSDFCRGSAVSEAGSPKVDWIRGPA
ncbi:MAG: transglutaminase-like domain-containing protein [Planctomycetaceae bacterium]